MLVIDRVFVEGACVFAADICDVGTEAVVIGDPPQANKERISISIIVYDKILCFIFFSSLGEWSISLLIIVAQLMALNPHRT